MAKKVKESKIKAWLNTRSGRVDIGSLVLAIITVILFQVFTDLQTRILISFIFFMNMSIFFGVMGVDLYLKYRKKIITNLFQFLFFLFLFFSTLFATLMTQYSGKVESVEQYLGFLQFNWLWMVSFGLAFVFGYYHYIEKADV